ncbi:hypothetical protein D3C72_1637980 [compost metagenome]
MRQLHAGTGLEQLRAQVGARAGARGAVVDLLGMLPGIRYEFLHRLVRPGGIDDHDRRGFRDRADRHEILQRVVPYFPVQRQVRRHRALCAVKQRIAVSRRMRHHFRANHATGTGAVLHHNRLP